MQPTERMMDALVDGRIYGWMGEGEAATIEEPAASWK
jgi:hypothetical protein